MENKEKIALSSLYNFTSSDFEIKVLATEKEADFCLYNEAMNEENKKSLFLILNTKTIAKIMNDSFKTIAEGMKEAFNRGLFIDGNILLPECAEIYPDTKVFYLEELFEGMKE